MNIKEIKTAVEAGRVVHWSIPAYTVVKGQYDWLIVHDGGHAIGLTWTDETTLNGKEEDFYIADEVL